MKSQLKNFLLFIILITVSDILIETQPIPPTAMPGQGIVRFCSEDYPIRPVYCPITYSPVCVEYSTCVNIPCVRFRQFTNSCFACQNADAESFETGTCSMNSGGSEEESLEEEHGEEELLRITEEVLEAFPLE